MAPVAQIGGVPNEDREIRKWNLGMEKHPTLRHARGRTLIMVNVLGDRMSTVQSISRKKLVKKLMPSLSFGRK